MIRGKSPASASFCGGKHSAYGENFVRTEEKRGALWVFSPVGNSV